MTNLTVGRRFIFRHGPRSLRRGSDGWRRRARGPRRRPAPSSWRSYDTSGVCAIRTEYPGFNVPQPIPVPDGSRSGRIGLGANRDGARPRRQGGMSQCHALALRAGRHARRLRPRALPEQHHPRSRVTARQVPDLIEHVRLACRPRSDAARVAGLLHGKVSAGEPRRSRRVGPTPTNDARRRQESRASGTGSGERVASATGPRLGSVRRMRRVSHPRCQRPLERCRDRSPKAKPCTGTRSQAGPSLGKSAQVVGASGAPRCQGHAPGPCTSDHPLLSLLS